MNHVRANSASISGVAAPVNLPAGESGTGTLLPPHEFQLVSFGKFGEPQPLPPGLDDLPLYPEDDGFCSVNGPLDLPAVPCEAAGPVDRVYRSAIHHLSSGGSSFLSENPAIAPLHQEHCPNNYASRSGPLTRSEESKYLCEEPGCTWRSPFQTKQALARHREVKHLNIRIDCPVPGCKNVGDRGIKRKDNLPAHLLKKHGTQFLRQYRGN